MHQPGFEPMTSCLPGRRTTNCATTYCVRHNLLPTAPQPTVSGVEVAKLGGDLAQNLETRRERLKSAPYLRLKKRKKNFKKNRIVPINVEGGTLWD